MKIVITRESTINAIGKQRNANRKEVFCITDGKIYASGLDVAEAIGVTGAAISQNVTGIAHTCAGKKFCFAKDVAEHLEEISESMQNRQKMYENAVTESAKIYAENAELRAENKRLRSELSVAKECAEYIGPMQEELNALRKELAEYKDREWKRQRIQKLEAEIEKLKGEL